jgi:hypothetical protein
MKSLVFLIILFILTSCSTDKDTYWCGDHPCINKKEKEAYFKKTMIVEIKDLKKKTPKSNSEIEKIIQQARKGEKKRIKEEKTMAKQGKLEAKRIKKEEKNLLKQTKLEAKRKKKEEKSSAKQIEMDQAIIIKKKEKTSKQSVDIDAGNETLTSSLTNFDKLLEKITRRNISRPYPDINDIQE